MLDLAGAIGASVERLRDLAIPLQGVGIQQVPTGLRQGESAFVVSKIDGLDEPLVSEMMHRARVNFELGKLRSQRAVAERVPASGLRSVDRVS